MPAANGPEDQPTASEVLRLEGSALEPEEMAALAAVLAQMQSHEAVVSGRRRAERGVRLARPDRALLRRGDLGLWSRPGRDQWRRAGGWR